VANYWRVISSTDTQARTVGPVLVPQPETSTRGYATSRSLQPTIGFTEQDSNFFLMPLVSAIKAIKISCYQEIGYRNALV